MTQNLTPPESDTDATPSWESITEADFFDDGRAECGCTRAVFAAIDGDPRGDAAVLHAAETCTAGFDAAHMAVHLARYLGWTVADGVEAVAVTREQLRDQLSAFKAGAAARAEARAFAQAFTEASELQDALRDRLTEAEWDQMMAEPVIDSDAVLDHYRATLRSVSARETAVMRRLREGGDPGLASRADSMAATAETYAFRLSGGVPVPSVAPATVPPAGTVPPAAVADTRASAAPRGIPASILGYMEHDHVWSMTPALTRIATEADSLGISRWSLLGASLARVSAAIPPRVQLVGLTGEPGSAGEANLDVFVVISGPGGNGKSLPIKAARRLCPAVFKVHATATGEGLNKGLRKQQFDEKGTPTIRRWCAAAMVEEAEGENFERMALTRDSTFLPQLRLHWGGDLGGKETADADRVTSIDAMWARVAALLVLHPEACALLLSQVGNGSSARFVWLPAYRTGQPQNGAVVGSPFALPTYGEPDGLPEAVKTVGPGAETPPPVFWIRRPPAMQAEMDREGINLFVDPVAVTEIDDDEARRMHDGLQRFKLAAVLSAMDGIAQPEDVHWFAACEIVEVSHLVQQGLQGAVARVREIAAENKGEDLAVTDVARTAVRDHLVAGDQLAAESEILSVLFDRPMARSALRSKLGRRARRGYGRALGYLMGAGVVTEGPAGLQMAPS